MGAYGEHDKAGKPEYRDSEMTRGMQLTSGDLDKTGKPVKWRVENSFGTQSGDKGYRYMLDGWFDKHLFEIIVSKKYLCPELLRVLSTEPVSSSTMGSYGDVSRVKSNFPSLELTSSDPSPIQKIQVSTRGFFSSCRH